MKISVQTIVFNAESVLPKGMLEANIRQHESVPEISEIIVVHGPTGNCVGMTPDGTLDLVRSLAEKNPKIKVVTRESWPDKTAMCNAGIEARDPDTDYVWQVDSDEFYHEDDIPRIMDFLKWKRPDAVHFYANHFWGSFGTCMDETQTAWANQIPWMRLFRVEPRSRWISHAPPVMGLDDGRPGEVVVDRDETLKSDIRMYHYGFVERSQIVFKALYFGRPAYLTHWTRWQKDHGHEIMGCRTRDFPGEHPKQVRALLYAR